jgi:hypothetical protein
MRNLTDDEMLAIEGGAAYTCALLGGLSLVAFASGNWWALAGALIASYSNDCFSGIY